MPQLRRDKTAKRKLRKLFKESRATRTRRGAGEERTSFIFDAWLLLASHVTIPPKGCTVGNITQVTISDASFPFGYDLTQFDLCLDLDVLQQNLYAICEKVDDEDFQKIILRKLNQVEVHRLDCVLAEDCGLVWICWVNGSVQPCCIFSQAFPSGVSDTNVQLLQSASRVVSAEDIGRWEISSLDTLSALMNPDDGLWEAVKVCAVVWTEGIMPSLTLFHIWIIIS